MTLQHSQIKPQVLPIDRDKYDAALREAKPLTFRGYIAETIESLEKKGHTYVPTQIQSVVRGTIRNWVILNEIRSIVGLSPILNIRKCTDADVADAVKLNSVQ